MIRNDFNDQILDQKEKNNAIISKIKELHSTDSLFNFIEYNKSKFILNY